MPLSRMSSGEDAIPLIQLTFLRWSHAMNLKQHSLNKPESQGLDGGGLSGGQLSWDTGINMVPPSVL